MIHADPLVFSYPNSKDFTYPEISLEGGESMLVLGNSGSGKTTLLHLLAGLLKPSVGSIEIGSERKVLSEQNDRFRGQNIGVVFQQPYFVKSLSVEKNLRVAQSMAGAEIDVARVDQLLQQLGLEGRGQASIGDLSTGELQRVSIARALINKPQVVLADEPTASLDDQNCEKVIRLLEEACRDVGSSLIVVTHDKRLEGRFTKSIRL